jgi:sugar O-acyltransferase (sialic acid O-acetyltransferase NeuD family)
MNQSEPIVVFGAGGHIKVVLATIEAENRYKVFGLLDDDEGKHGSYIFEYRVLGGKDDLLSLRDEKISKALVAIGKNLKRAQVSDCLEKKGFELVTVIHPSATLIRGCRLGKGTLVLPHAHVGADSILGRGVILSVGTVVGHDCEVGAWGHLSPGAKVAGNVRIGEFTHIGMNASVLPGIKIGANTVVGANAVVVHDLPDNVTAAGVPAKIIGKGNEEK